MTATEQKTQFKAGQSFDGVLCTLITIQESTTKNSSLRERLLFLQKKLASNQLYVAVLGQMKRGKSSFINALLGTEVLPTGILPVTAVITEIRYGLVPEALILYSTGHRDKVELNTLAAYVTESGNPGNKKQVASVELAYPAPFLEGGIILIDTPGIGSTHVHNTLTTEGYLEQIDAGIVVLSVDPPITEVESQFVRGLKEEIPKLFFVLNKVDLGSPEEVCQVSRFLEEELSRLRLESPEIFCLSARRALENCRQGKPEAASSGIESFERRLRTFLSEEKTQVLIRSIALDALQIARTLKFAATISMRAQAMSPEDLRAKRLALDEMLKTTDAEMHELQVLVRQHSADILAGVEQGLNRYVKECVPVLRQRLQDFQSQHSKEPGRTLGTLLESFLMEQIETIFRSWRVREDEAVQAELDLLSMRFVERANATVERLQQTAGVLFEIPTETVSITCPLRLESRLSYRIERVFHSLDSFLLLLPRFLLRPIVFRKMTNRVWRLLDMNAGRIRYDYVERLQASMTQFERDFCAAVLTLPESLRSVLREPSGKANEETEVLETLNNVIRVCSELVA